MQRPKPAQTGPWQIEIERGPGELRGNHQPDGKPGDAPEHRHDGRELDRTEVVVWSAVEFLRRQLQRPVIIAVEDGKERPKAGDAAETRMKGKGGVQRLCSSDQ